MPQKTALTQLFSQEPCRGLISANYTTVWLEARVDESQVRARDAGTNLVNQVTTVSDSTLGQLIALTLQVLSGKEKVDVMVNGQEFMITRFQVVGGFEYAIASRSRLIGHDEFSSAIDVAVPV